MSTCRNPDGFEQLPLESVLRGTSSEIGAEPARLKRPFDTTAPLALKFEGEDIARADDLAFHAADFADALDPPNSIAHALDLHEDIDGARNLRAQRSQRQIRRRH